MTCNEVRQHWMLYLDSEGDAELHFHISDHLGLCPACAEWFAKQQRLEQALTDKLAADRATPALWNRVLTGAGVRPRVSRQRWLFLSAALTTAAVLLAVLIAHQPWGPGHSSELAPLAADWHQQLVQGDKQPDLVSSSDEEVERYLRRQVSFPVHCPPRKDARFTLRGAGVCQVNDRRAAYFVGQVAEARVSIFVLPRASLDAFPRDREHLAQGGGRHRCREGDYHMISGVTADNVVLVIGTAPPEALEKLLNAYGSYHEG